MQTGGMRTDGRTDRELNCSHILRKRLRTFDAFRAYNFLHMQKIFFPFQLESLYVITICFIILYFICQNLLHSIIWRYKQIHLTLAGGGGGGHLLSSVLSFYLKVTEQNAPVFKCVTSNVSHACKSANICEV